MDGVWNLKDIYKGKTQKKLVSELNTQVNALKRYRRRLKSLRGDEFGKFLEKSESVARLSSRLGSYVSLKLYENTSDPQRLMDEMKMSQTLTELENELLFFDQWFKNLSDKKAKSYIDACADYGYYLSRKRALRKYLLDEEMEKIINYKDLTGSETISKLYEIITNAYTYKVGGRTYNNSQMNMLKMDRRRSIRKKAYDMTLARYAKDKPALSEIYKSTVFDIHYENVKVRGFKSPISSRNLSNDVDDKTVEALLNAVEKNQEVFHRYYEIKAKILGMKKFDRYDLYTPYRESKKKIGYKRGCELVLECFREFDESAYLLAKKVIEEGHIHSAIQKNKVDGGFCMSYACGETPYILVNYNKRLQDVFTLAHELGHGIHALYAGSQNQYMFHSSLVVSETASVFMEMLLAKKLMEDESLKTQILLKLLDNQYATIMRQGFFTLFELKAHERIVEGATYEEIDSLYLESLMSHLHDAVYVPDVFKNEWLNIPHIFMSPFYCYSYCFGNLLVLSLYRRYAKNRDKFIPAYLKILAAGGSDKPERILKKSKVNINKKGFWKAGFETIKDEISQLESLY